MHQMAHSRYASVGSLHGTVSVPCAELRLWLLLHFEYTAQPFVVGAGLSSEDPLESLRPSHRGAAFCPRL